MKKIIPRLLLFVTFSLLLLGFILSQNRGSLNVFDETFAQVLPFIFILLFIAFIRPLQAKIILAVISGLAFIVLSPLTLSIFFAPACRETGCIAVFVYAPIVLLPSVLLFSILEKLLVKFESKIILIDIFLLIITIGITIIIGLYVDTSSRQTLNYRQDTLLFDQIKTSIENNTATYESLISKCGLFNEDVVSFLKLNVTDMKKSCNDAAEQIRTSGKITSKETLQSFGIYQSN